jgi:hypothetical protein
MLIKDLIQKLEELYNSYDEEYKATMGEPTIEIDVFRPIEDKPHCFQYAGFSHDIKIEKSDDGVYDILSAFSHSYPREDKK